MLIYEKGEGVNRHVYGTTASVPSENDQVLVYKDLDGDIVTPAYTDQFIDCFLEDANGKVYRGMKRVSDGVVVTAFINGETKAVIPMGWESVAKVLKSITVSKKPTKTTYVKSTNFDTTGMVVKATYESGEKHEVTGWTTNPADGSPVQSTAGTQQVTVSYTEGSVTKTATFNITVTEA